ncbi:hypothetical protein [Alysiella crassa]|uniref:HTH cro/C1-type domain-containing protein n=1 Tax=Alysiella crassa TaxID=153491 RepID=A0A376BU04_9NEIS|nr:hypothetical protein [Alysiella crassa]UOP05893.1 hypothetical protein LVJ80_08360 [Alysiella crassa]SSY80318.1 Uncharacterised protein [Alysiella crassa]
MKTTQQLLNELIDLGQSQHEISIATKVPQPTISRIIAGLNQTPFSRRHKEIFEYHQSIMQMENE